MKTKKIVIGAFIGILALVNVVMFTQNAISSDSSIASVFKLAEAKGYELPDVEVYPDEDPVTCYIFTYNRTTGKRTVTDGTEVICDGSGDGCTSTDCIEN